MSEFLYVRITGITATFKMPVFVSTSGIKSFAPSLSIPHYSTVLGMLGNIAGRELDPKEVKRLGYMFEYDNKNIDLEKLESYNLRQTLKRNKRITNPARREFLTHPTLHLYLENIELFLPYIQKPKNIPFFGRSQDLAWIESMEDGKQYQIVKAREVPEGKVKNVVIPFKGLQADGIIMPHADYYDNSKAGFTRKAAGISNYQFITNPSHIKQKGLYEVSNLNDYVIYMHKLPINKLLSILTLIGLLSIINCCK